MEINVLPRYDMSDNATGCCPRFNPDGWGGRYLHFRDKRFLRATTRGIMHVPVDMGSVFDRVNRHVEAAGGWDINDRIVLSRDLSAWQAEHLFSVPRDIPGEDMTTLSGHFITELFEGPYRKVPDWTAALEGMARARGHEPKGVRFFYTTCPRCAKVYGENHVVGLVEI